MKKSSMLIGYGMVLSMCGNGCIEDYYGKDAYLDALKTSWINTPFWIWPMLGFALFLLVGISGGFDD